MLSIVSLSVGICLMFLKLIQFCLVCSVFLVFLIFLLFNLSCHMVVIVPYVHHDKLACLELAFYCISCCLLILYCGMHCTLCALCALRLCGQYCSEFSVVVLKVSEMKKIMKSILIHLCCLVEYPFKFT